MPERMSLRQQLLTVPNILSSLRLAAVPVFLWLLLSNQNIAALILLAAAGLTDYLDGYFARRFNQVTRLGQLLDPAADRLYIISTLVGMTVAGHVPLWLTLVIVARDLVLILAYPVLASAGYGPLPVHYLGKAGTFALLYAFPLLLLAHIWAEASQVIAPVAWAFAFWGVGLYWWAGGIYLFQTFTIVKMAKMKNR